MELTVPRIGHDIVTRYLEETATVDGDIQRVVRRRDIALRELLEYRGECGTDTDLGDAA
jgi:hypothetical protein